MEKLTDREAMIWAAVFAADFHKHTTGEHCWRRNETRTYQEHQWGAANNAASVATNAVKALRTLPEEWAVEEDAAMIRDMVTR